MDQHWLFGSPAERDTITRIISGTLQTTQGRASPKMCHVSTFQNVNFKCVRIGAKRTLPTPKAGERDTGDHCGRGSHKKSPCVWLFQHLSKWRPSKEHEATVSPSRGSDRFHRFHEWLNLSTGQPRWRFL